MAAVATPPTATQTPAPPRPSRSATRTRTGVFGALALVLVVGLYLILHSHGGATYHLLFTNGGQLVKGDQVQVGGVPIGSITDIALTDNNLAEVTVRVDSSLTPLHQGTTAQIRATSLSGVANRYVALAPGPNSAPELADGATLPTTATQGIVDIDQIFDTLDARTRQGLAQVIRGSAVQYAGTAADLRSSTAYFAPSLTSADHVVSELTRDQAAFTDFILNTSRAVTAIASRRDQLASLVGNADATFGAISVQSTALAQALRQLPATLKQGTTTLHNLSPTLDAVTRLVDVSKPDTRTLAPFLAQLAPFLSASVAPVNELAAAISQPGPNNDLTDATLSLPALSAALGTASPDTVAALHDGAPVTSFLRPYTPDLVGWLRDFGQISAYYDANGHYARVSPVFADFGAGPTGALVPITPQAGVAPLVTGQLSRCPGAATQPLPDGSAPWNESATLDCSPTQVPPG